MRIHLLFLACFLYGGHGFIPGSPDSRQTTPRPAGGSFSLTIMCPPEGVHHYARIGFCDQYIKCWEGQLSQHTCPEGLLFNRDKGGKHFPCDYSENINCPKSSRFSCPGGLFTPLWSKEKTFHRSPDNCREFYVCVGGVPKRQRCHLGKVFSEKMSTCTQPKNVPGCEDFYRTGGLVTRKDEEEEKEHTQDNLSHLSYDLSTNQHLILLK